MASTIEVARRGQITIPKEIRDRLGIEEGQKYGLRVLEGGVLILTPRSGRATLALSQLRNTLINQGASLDEMLEELRRLRESNAE